MTWQYDKGRLWFVFGEPATTVWKSEACCCGFPSSDVCLWHSKELARWLSFLNELAAPRASQGAWFHLFWSLGAGGGGDGLFSCCWELATKLPHCYARARWTNLPRKAEFFRGGRAAPGEGCVGWIMESVYQKLTLVASFQVSLLESRMLEIWGEPKARG